MQNYSIGKLSKKVLALACTSSLMMSAVYAETAAERAIKRSNIVPHYKGDVTVLGEYTVKKGNDYGVQPHQFGIAKITGLPPISKVQEIQVREMHWPISYTKKSENSPKKNYVEVGYEILPVVDQGHSSAYLESEDGQELEVKGSELLDAKMAETLGPLDDVTNPYFAVITYYHPEQSKTELSFSEAVSPSNLKPEMGFTHMGAYIGKGRTRNSPYGYHSKVFHHEGYPPIVSTVGLKGVDQKEFNKNAYITLRLLNEGGISKAHKRAGTLRNQDEGSNTQVTVDENGSAVYETIDFDTDAAVIFPSNYKFDWFHAFNTQEVFAHFQGWIDPRYTRKDYVKKLVKDGELDKDEDKELIKDLEKSYLKFLKERDVYATYCAEHITLVLNVAANLVQNEEGYIEAFGKKRGKKLWKAVKKEWKAIMENDGTPELAMPQVDINAFKKGSNSLLLSGSGTYGIADAGTDEARTGALNGTTVGKALVWSPLTNSELVSNFVNVYFPWKTVGAPLSVAASLGFKDEIGKRMGLDDTTYVQSMIPVAVSMLKWDLYSRVVPAAGDSKEVMEQKYQAAKARLEAELTGALGQATQLSVMMLGALEEALGQTFGNAGTFTFADKIKSARDINGRSPEAAYGKFQKEIQESLFDFKGVKVSVPFIETLKLDYNGSRAQRNVTFYSPPKTLHAATAGVGSYNDKLILKTFGIIMHPDELAYHPGRAKTIYKADENGNASATEVVVTKAQIAADLAAKEEAEKQKELERQRAAEARAQAQTQQDDEGQAPVPVQQDDEDDVEVSEDNSSEGEETKNNRG